MEVIEEDYMRAFWCGEGDGRYANIREKNLKLRLFICKFNIS